MGDFNPSYGRIDLRLRQLYLVHPSFVPAALGFGLQPDSHEPQDIIFRQHARAQAQDVCVVVLARGTASHRRGGVVAASVALIWFGASFATAASILVTVNE